LIVGERAPLERDEQVAQRTFTAARPTKHVAQSFAFGRTDNAPHRGANANRSRSGTLGAKHEERILYYMPAPLRITEYPLVRYGLRHRCGNRRDGRATAEEEYRKERGSH
jgi:hypothetical protein